MSVLWSVPQRQVILRANLLPATTGATQFANYSTANIGDTQMADRSIQFPELAVDDALLNAADRMVGRIGNNPFSPYRTAFQDVTASVASGGILPVTSTTAKPIIGVVGDVRNASSPFQKLNFADEHIVKAWVNTLSTNLLKVNPHLYWTDNYRIYHTETNITADVVIWSMVDQLAALQANPRTACPFPENLIPLLVVGALSFVFRDKFNESQAQIYAQRFETMLDTMLPLDNLPQTQERIQGE